MKPFVETENFSVRPILIGVGIGRRCPIKDEPQLLAAESEIEMLISRELRVLLQNSSHGANS